MAPRSRYEDDTLDSLLEQQPGQSAGGYNLSTGDDTGQLFSDFVDQRSQRDPEVESAWRDLQLQKIAEAKQGAQEYGVGEGLRDTLPALASLGIDAAVNHGRGAAGILTATANETANQEAQRQVAARNAATIAVQARGKPFDPLALMRAQTARGNAVVTAQRRGDQVRKYEDAGNPDSDHTQGVIKIQGLKAGAQAEGRIKAEDELNPIVVKNKSAIRAGETAAELGAEHEGAPVKNADEAERARLAADASTTARLAAEHEGAPVSAADEAEKARKVAEAREPSEARIKGTPTASDQRQQELTDLAQSPIPGIETVDQRAYRAANPDATRRAANELYVKTGLSTLEKLRAMETTRAAIGPKWNTLNDQEKRVQLDKMANDRLLAIGGLSTMGNTATLNAGEFPRYGEGVPDGGYDQSDVWDTLIGAAPGMSKRDTQLEKLQGTRRSVEEAFARGLGMMGARLPQGAAPPGALPPTAAPPQGAGMPGYNHDGLPPGPNLGDTGRSRNVPPLPAGAVQSHHIRKKDGSVIETRMPIEQLSNLPDGWELVD